jgi:hypothetical protein
MNPIYRNLRISILSNFLDQEPSYRIMVFGNAAGLFQDVQYLDQDFGMLPDGTAIPRPLVIAYKSHWTCGVPHYNFVATATVGLYPPSMPEYKL